MTFKGKPTKLKKLEEEYSCTIIEVDGGFFIEGVLDAQGWINLSESIWQFKNTVEAKKVKVKTQPATKSSGPGYAVSINGNGKLDNVNLRMGINVYSAGKLIGTIVTVDNVNKKVVIGCFDTNGTINIYKDISIE
jgi:rRNA maturation endonuclease Nob1